MTFDRPHDSAGLRIQGPPHSDEAEQAFLGGLILDNTMWPEVSDIVRSEDFYRNDHRTLFESMLALFQARKPVDLVTVTDQLSQTSRLEEAGVRLMYQARLLAAGPI